MKNVLKLMELGGSIIVMKESEVKVMEKLLTPEEVADILKFSKKTVQNYISNGRIKSVKVFGANRVRESDLLDLIKERGDK